MPVPDAGWVFLPEDAVPERWRERAVPVCLVPLLPEEARGVLAGNSVVPGVDPQDEPVARLLARGLAPRAIAGELGLSLRHVYRKVAGLRDLFGVESTQKLTAELARRGFGG